MAPPVDSQDLNERLLPLVNDNNPEPETSISRPQSSPATGPAFPSTGVGAGSFLPPSRLDELRETLIEVNLVDTDNRKGIFLSPSLLGFERDRLEALSSKETDPVIKARLDASVDWIDNYWWQELEKQNRAILARAQEEYDNRPRCTGKRTGGFLFGSIPLSEQKKDPAIKTHLKEEERSIFDNSRQEREKNEINAIPMQKEYRNRPRFTRNLFGDLSERLTPLPEQEKDPGIKTHLDEAEGSISGNRWQEMMEEAWREDRKRMARVEEERKHRSPFTGGFFEPLFGRSIPLSEKEKDPQSGECRCSCFKKALAQREAERLDIPLLRTIYEPGQPPTSGWEEDPVVSSSSQSDALLERMRNYLAQKPEDERKAILEELGNPHTNKEQVNTKARNPFGRS